MPSPIPYDAVVEESIAQRVGVTAIAPASYYAATPLNVAALGSIHANVPWFPLPPTPPVMTPIPVTIPTLTPTTSSLDAAIAAIPVANDGDAITAEYHNSLRSAIRILAASGGASLDSLPARHIEPRFTNAAVDGAETFGYVFPGIAVASTAGSAFLRLSVSGGVRLASIALAGTIEKMNLTFELLSVPRGVDQTATTVLATSKTNDGANGPFEIAALAKTPRQPNDPRGVVDLTIVDNDSFIYALRVTTALPNTDNGARVTIQDIQLEYQPS